jgi:N-acetylmuramoyl-L-alanine amidase
MKRNLFFLFVFITTATCSAQDTANAFFIKYYTEKVQKYLDKEKALAGFYTINYKGIEIYASAADKLKNKPEFRIEWTKLNDFRLYYKFYDDIFKYYQKGSIETFPVNGIIQSPEKGKEKPLQGYKIAIDPGHISHDHITGDLEKKHLKFQKDIVRGLVDSIEISEGILTYATAILLKDKLEADGAEVMLTRPEGYSAFGKTFSQWKKEDMKRAVDSLFNIGEIKTSQRQYFLSSKAQDRDIFRVIFRDLELAKRAELINKFKPDFSVIIHFNVDETNLGWSKPGTKNFNMAFVGGAFMKNDLSSPEKRFEFLRLLITEDLERSITLSSSVVSNFERSLKVNTCGDHDAKYIAEGCLSTGKKGVYCRNLQLNRYIHSPLVYGETLYQDNIKECQELNKETDKTKNERIISVANAYYSGILDYIKLQK